jgi:hypothetical protein
MNGGIETIERTSAGANTDREPSRLAALGAFASVGNVRSLSATRMLRAGTARGPSEKSAQARGGRISTIVNPKS